jgi:diguanylate cyclase (GGDEF)-like protein
MSSIIEYLNKLPKPLIILLGVLFVAIVGFVDYISGLDISTSIFYLLPISLVTLFVGGIFGIVFSVASATIWLINDLIEGGIFSSPFIPYWNAIVRLGIFLIVTYILLSLKRESLFARTDFLTGVSNRRNFIEVGSKVLTKLNVPFTIAYIDLDNFKDINDNHSHHAGNIALQVIAHTISGNLRVNDLVARLGGDEFAILLPDTGYEESERIIQRVQKEIAENTREKSFFITLSIGMITFNKSPNNIVDAIRQTDELMYSVKRTGKNMIKHEVISNE